MLDLEEINKMAVESGGEVLSSMICMGYLFHLKDIVGGVRFEENSGGREEGLGFICEFSVRRTERDTAAIFNFGFKDKETLVIFMEKFKCYISSHVGS